MLGSNKTRSIEKTTSFVLVSYISMEKQGGRVWLLSRVSLIITLHYFVYIYIYILTNKKIIITIIIIFIQIKLNKYLKI